MNSFIILTTLWGLLAVAECTLDHQFCKDESMILSGTVGDTGTLKFDRNTTSSGKTCVVQIRSCSSCAIHITGAWDKPFNCKAGYPSLQCSQDCPNVYIFDKDYINETLQYYTRQTINFQSESSSIYIGLCLGINTNYSLELTYLTTRKGASIDGSSVNGSTGLITSPFFPLNYALNSEMYEYVITSPVSSDLIRLEFDDWHLADTSSFYFLNTRSKMYSLVTGSHNRPVIESEVNKLSIQFHTGHALAPGENRNFIGFSARYNISKERYSIPITDCKTHGYYLKQNGGTLSFTGRSSSTELYDCLWVVQTQPGFEDTYLKIVKFKSHSSVTFQEPNSLIIRSGVTSQGVKVQHYHIQQNIEDGIGYQDPTGFYIRLTGHFDSSAELVLSYNSFRYGKCDGLYTCGNGRCISTDLVCDGYNNCGDHSDEGQGGCPDNVPYPDKSYQYTITIGVIVPMVISVFLIMIICLLFVMIRRCRRARLNANSGESTDRIRTLSEDVASNRRGRRRRRHRHRMFGSAERDLPPSYDEAMQNPPGWYLNVAFGNPVDPSLPQPPPYTETSNTQEGQDNNNQHPPHGSPSSTNSSQSELTVCSRHISDSSSSSDEGSTWGNYGGDGEGRRGRRERHVSSSESEAERSRGQGHHHGNRSEQRESRSNSVAMTTDMANGTELKTERTKCTEDKNEEIKLKKINGKLVSKEANDTDAFVIPDGPKLGSSEIDHPPNVHTSYPRSYENAAEGDRFKDPETWSSHKVQNTLQTLSRKVSTGSDQTAEMAGVPKKKPRKSKGQTGQVSNDNQSYELRNRDCWNDDSNIQENTRPREQDYNMSEAQSTNLPVPAKRSEKPIYQSCPNLSYNTQDYQARLSNRNPDPNFDLVVNVDNDDVLFVYDQPDSRQKSQQSRASSLLALPRKPLEDHSIDIENNTYSVESRDRNRSRDYDSYARQTTSSDQLNRRSYMDGSISSSYGNGNQRGEGRLSYLGQGHRGSSEQLHRGSSGQLSLTGATSEARGSYITLVPDEPEISEDIYV